MKLYEKLTRRGQLRRLNNVAKTALKEYGLGDAPYKLFADHGNVIYRVINHMLPDDSKTYSPFYKNHCTLRVHQPGHQTAEAIRSELMWLAALRKDADLPVPEPFPSCSGDLLVEVFIPGIPEPMNCSLLRWVEGKRIGEQAQPHHFRAQGRLMAYLHEHAANWQLPKAFKRRHLDIHGLVGINVEYGCPPSQVRSHIPLEYKPYFETITQQGRELMEDWGKGPDVFGLIHADLAFDANMLWGSGEVRAIDFDECAFGYWVYDLGISLEHVWGDTDFWVYKNALMEGYNEVRHFPEEQREKLEFFIQVWHAHEMYWSIAVGLRFPHVKERMRPSVNHAGDNIIRFIEGSADS